MPALGFAMLARLLLNKDITPFLFLGFAVTVYLKVPLTGMAILGAIIAVIMVNINKNSILNVAGGVEDEDF